MKVLIGVAFLSVLLGGCNFYSSLDEPSGDAQILSKARACFDQGNFECAAKYYSLASANSYDESKSEQAFQILAQSGITTGVFISAAIDGSSSGGKLITKLANALTHSANKSTRLNIFHANQMSSLITNQRTRGLIRFITAASFVAEILAENSSTPGRLAQSDLVLDPSGCIASKPLYLSTGCNSPENKNIITGNAIPALRNATDEDITGPGGSPTLHMIHSGIREIDLGISEMETTGSLGSSSSSFAANLTSIADAALVPNTDSKLYRASLIEFEVGEP